MVTSNYETYLYQRKRYINNALVGILIEQGLTIRDLGANGRYEHKIVPADSRDNQRERQTLNLGKFQLSLHGIA
jgi:hypothetical protein